MQAMSIDPCLWSVDPARRRQLGSASRARLRPGSSTCRARLSSRRSCVRHAGTCVRARCQGPARADRFTRRMSWSFSRRYLGRAAAPAATGKRRPSDGNHPSRGAGPPSRTAPNAGRRGESHTGPDIHAHERLHREVLAGHPGLALVATSLRRPTRDADDPARKMASWPIPRLRSSFLTWPRSRSASATSSRVSSVRSGRASTNA